MFIQNFVQSMSLRDALQDFMPRLEEVSGVFPGHGTIDLHPKTLK